MIYLGDDINNWYWWGITSLVDDWVNNYSPNYGLMLKTDTEYGYTNDKCFSTWEYSSDYCPYLYLEYIPDQTPPTNLSISINSGNTYATSQYVTLTLSASDSGSGVGYMQFSNDNSTWSNWYAYSTTYSNWQLSSGDGLKSVYFRAKDNAGNISSSISDTIKLDTTLPTSQVTSLSATQTTTSFTVSWSGSDNYSGVKYYDVQYKDGSSGAWTNWKWQTILTSATFTGSDGHTYYFQSRAYDNAGNIEAYPSALSSINC